MTELTNAVTLLSKVFRTPLPRQLTRTKSTDLTQNPYLDDVRPNESVKIPPEKFISVGEEGIVIVILNIQLKNNDDFFIFNLSYLIIYEHKHNHPSK